ncbi:hypothetical protein GCM10010433_23890 [Streptomyces pulveraceus]
MGRLRHNWMPLPGVSAPARQLPEVRVVADEPPHATVAGAARRVDAALPGDPVATLKTPEGSRSSELERFRRPPTRTTRTGFARALERVPTLPQLGKASRVLARAAKALFEEPELVEEHGTDVDVAALWSVLEEVAPRASVMTSAATVVSPVPEDEDAAAWSTRSTTPTTGS